MSAYLLVWSAKKSSFTDERYREELPEGPGSWSNGKRKAPAEPGSDFFFLRVGREPKGIIGYGTITSEGYPDDHWDDDKYERGENEIYCDLKFERWTDCLNHPERVLTLDILRHAGLTHTDWTPQRTVAELKDPSDVSRLKELFDELQQQDQPTQEPDGNDPRERVFIEGGRRFVAARSRPARDRVLVTTKKKFVLARTGRLACEGCNFDFTLTRVSPFLTGCSPTHTGQHGDEVSFKGDFEPP
ncbi:MAG: hypothetical protein JO069_02985 [Verrucomicrobia bacterium]|nr:hypothetical protein [Verrucomicrobiota bacterium]